MHKSVLAIVAVLACAGATPTQAQHRTACPGNEMRFWSGQCVNAGLSARMRHHSIRMNEVMINQWMYPDLPSTDRNYPRGFDVNRFETSVHGTGSTAP